MYLQEFESSLVILERLRKILTFEMGRDQRQSSDTGLSDRDRRSFWDLFLNCEMFFA